MTSEPPKPAEHVRFGDGFELDARAYELRRAGRTLKLERIPMEVLRLLVEEKGQLVSRDRIIERVWGREVFLDTDDSINAARPFPSMRRPWRCRMAIKTRSRRWRTRMRRSAGASRP
jgi:hypothetical protein